MTSQINSLEGNAKQKQSSEDEKMKQNLDKFENLYLGKDHSINDEYLQKFYLDVAQKVNTIT